MDTSNPSHLKGKRSGLREKSVSLGREVYWVTLSAKDDAKPFGTWRGGETVLNARGKALAATWREIADIRPNVEPDAMVIGTRRIQGILSLSLKKKDHVSLDEVIKLFKVLSSLRLAQLGKVGKTAKLGKPADRSDLKPGASTRGIQGPAALWKKGFTEMAISGSAELAEARKALKGLQAR
ncbi:MAG: hypothetical protein ABI036_06200 [Fibrobacteria bacterium]